MTTKTPPPIQKMPAARALAWLSGSWGLIKRQALRLMLISLFFQFFLSFSQIQAIGLLVILFLPVLSVGMLHAFMLVEHGEKPMLASLFIAFSDRHRISKLLLLGGIVVVVGLLVMTMVMTMVLAGSMVDIDPAIIARIEQGDMEAVKLIDPQIMEDAVLAMVIGAAVSGSITYFSMPLIWFSNQGVGSALVVGFKALLINWKSLLVMGLLLGCVAVPIVLLLGSFYLSALSGGISSNILLFLLLLFGSMYQLLLFGTQYLAFRDIFGVTDVADKSRKKAADQLVA